MTGSHALTLTVLAALALPAAPSSRAAVPGAPSWSAASGDGGASILRGNPLQSDDEHVTVALVADTASVAPGQRFRLGVLLRIDPSWHVYWINAGEGGYPTTARITGPDGFAIGPVRFPAPHRFTMPGDIVAYGYETELLLLVDVTAPAELAPGTKLAFGAKAGWLECADVCIPGDGEAGLELVAAPEAAAARDAERALFARWTARLPRPWSDLEGARASWSGGEAAPRLRVETPGVEPVELFPYENARSKLEGQRVEGGALVADYRFRESDSRDPLAAAGVLRVRAKDGAEAFYELDLPWTSTGAAGPGD